MFQYKFKLYFYLELPIHFFGATYGRNYSLVPGRIYIGTFAVFRVKPLEPKQFFVEQSEKIDEQKYTFLEHLSSYWNI